MKFLKPLLVEVFLEAFDEAWFVQQQKREKRYYTREEACKHLKIGCTTFYRLAQKGKITILKIEGRTLVDADELDKAIETRRIFRYQH